MSLTIQPTTDPGLALQDPIESARFELSTDRPVSPSPVDPDRIPFPVDRAVAVEVGELVVPKLVHVAVRRPDGGYLSEFEPGEAQVVESGDRLLDVSTAPMVLYLHVPGPVTLSTEDGAVRISLERAGEVVVGSRSFHERPATTITVPPEPHAAIEAVSTFGSALKTESCERSYPTLRGHPPRLEFGSELSIPEEITPPSTDVHIEIPPNLEYVFPAAPLSYYLGATVRPADRPALHADGFTHTLDGPGGFEASVHRTLRRVFLLDSVVRTEGIYQVPLPERGAVADLLPQGTTLGDLYGAPLAEQLETYLTLPPAGVDRLLPEWPLCVDVVPEPPYLEALPYLVDDLALVRCASRDRASGRPSGAVVAEQQAAVEAAVDDFVRSDGGRTGELAHRDASPGGWSFDDAFRLPAAPAVEHAYLGPGCPLGVNKCSVSALRRRLDRSPAESPGISVRIVCNDDAMAAEDVVEEYYGLRDLVQFDVTVDYGLETDELRAALAADLDFLHYVGHIEEDGIACPDGRLDVRTLDSVGVDAFLLNACSSYEQGQALISAGAQGGVVTNATVSNVVATAMGRTLARALNGGFTLRSALSLADGHHATSYRYLVLGDGGMQLVQGDSGVPYSLSLAPQADEDGYHVSVYSYPAYGPGITFQFHTESFGPYLPFGHIDTQSLGTEALLSFFQREILPVSINGELYWSDELSENVLASL